MRILINLFKLRFLYFSKLECERELWANIFLRVKSYLSIELFYNLFWNDKTKTYAVNINLPLILNKTK